jgi:hypothetical protein
MRVVRRVLLGLVSVVALLYLGDDLAVRLPIPRKRDPFGQVTVYRLDTIPQKNGKVEYAPEPPAKQTCIHSLFPHMGYAPCWYLSRHAEQRVNY